MASHGPLPNASWQKLLPGLVCEWLNEPRPSVLYILWADAQECVLHSTCPRACTSKYTPMGLYWLIQALGHVLLNTHFCVSSLRKTESVLENTLGQVRGTWRVKIKYITFKNWIMLCKTQLAHNKASNRFGFFKQVKEKLTSCLFLWARERDLVV